jgi:hypothetical protein
MAEVGGRTGGRPGGRAVRPATRSVDPFVAAVRQLREKALASLRDRFWLPEQRMYAFALLEGGTLRPELTAWPSTAMAFGLFDEARGMAGASTQAGAALNTDWGSRSLAGTSPLFDPLHYNNGTVWPFVTGFTALGQYRYGNPVAGFQALMQIVRSGTTWGLGRNPEVFAGMQFEPLETAVPQQFFGTSFLPTVVSRGLLGWEPDAPAGTIRLAPQLPAAWDHLTVRNAPMAERRYEIRIQRSPTELRVAIHRTAGAVADTLLFTAHLPLGAGLTDSKIRGGVALPSSAPRETPRDLELTLPVVLTEDVEFVLQYQPGYEVLLPDVTPRRGDRSRGIRLVDQRLEGGALHVTLDGPAGSTDTIVVRRGAAKKVPVRFPEQGDSVDGYARVELRVE